MNYIKHLAGFFDKVAADERLNPTHVSMYVSLFQFWNASRFENPISISRSELMRVSKISSTATYHKCIKELHDYGYFNYMPSYNPFKGSLVYLFDLHSGAEQAVTSSHTNIETGNEQALAPYINTLNINKHTNSINSTNSSEHVQRENLEERQLRRKPRRQAIPQNIGQVQQYFSSRNFPPLEAEKFFHYFSSNGWLVGGKTPMRNWQAAAENWMLNLKSVQHVQGTYQPTTHAQHHTATDKDYSEPL